ncbi:MAG: universal stress protein, partial [Nitrosopumilaceae archaeon]|nr:universal stress protein [Nitrosopumilaceae archaeon]NIU85792.1 universal stress protein [Nitrosopumilaceae archaeon]NIV64651.1 universal stress protein [Nitrosopumilaceae archaeon]NIX60038.1 universal stress protein [Nitrosopumilaceae archaeon]
MKHFPVRIKAILVPHDGTLAGDKALSYAVQMAKTTGATIYLLHIIESPPIAPVFILTKQEKKRLEKGIQDELTFIKKDVSLELKERV